jgi:ubiquinone/menaquinone biosynthesis C-methylase UbiE
VSFFNLSYLGVPPWDIGAPQPEIVRLEAEGRISGSVLDAGCGTGENALYLADKGHEVWGIDSAPNALRKARRKARERGIQTRFLRADALDLGILGRTFDTVVDCGLFHTFSDGERTRYVESLSTVLRPGGQLVLLCFSDEQGGTLGPRRVSQTEIRAAFARGWAVNAIDRAVFGSTMGPVGALAWSCRITRTGQ